MIEFNNTKEKKFLTILLEMSKEIEINLGTFLALCILNKDRIVEIKTGNVNLIFNVKIESELDFVNELCEIISLIETLKDEKLIFVHTNPEILKRTLANKNYSNPIEGFEKVNALTNDKLINEKIATNSTHYGKWELPTNLSEFLLKYVNEFCFLRPELSEYIINNFRTSEQIRFQKNLLWTQIAAVISFIGLLIAVLIPLFQ